MSPLWLGKWKGKVALRKLKHYHPNTNLTLPLPNGEIVYLDKSLEEDLPECLRADLHKVKGYGSKETPMSIIELAMHTCLKQDPMALQKLGQLWTEGARKVKDDDETELKGTEKKRTISLIETAMSIDLRQDPMGLQKLGNFIDEGETNVKDTLIVDREKPSLVEMAMSVDLKTDPMALQKLVKR